MTAVLFLDKASLILLQAEIEHNERREESLVEHCVDAGLRELYLRPLAVQICRCSL